MNVRQLEIIVFIFMCNISKCMCIRRKPNIIIARNTCMQQPLALIGIQGTIFSEHEVFRVYDFEIVFIQYFSKNVKIMKVLSVLITKYIISTNFLGSNTINILI